jgi:ubiquinone/menaquinone biosynthesis C-methylase UbiE
VTDVTLLADIYLLSVKNYKNLFPYFSILGKTKPTGMKHFWDEKFSLSPNLYGENPNKFLEEELLKLPPGKILLPGEGEGRNAIFAASLKWQVTAIDQSEVGSTRALQKAQDLNLTLDYLVGDIRDYKFEKDKFDVLALIYFHLPISIQAEVHTNLIQSLKKGGVLLVEGFGKKQLEFKSGGPKSIDMLYDLNSLKHTFPEVHWLEQFDGIITLEEGEGHKGDAHVIRLKGIKI